MEDILVMFPFCTMTDMANFMEKDFSMRYTGKRTFISQRREAETICAEKCAKKGIPLTIGMIYDTLMKRTKISPSSRDELMKRECELAVYFCQPRNCGRQLFKTARSGGRRVIITSHSIYPEQTVREMLEKCGYTGFSELIMTARQKKSLSGAELCDLIISKARVSAGEIVHIGSDISADVEEPVMKQMRAVLIPPVMQLMIKSGRLRGFAEKELLLNISEKNCFALRTAFALYAMYGFDIPQNKTVHSDFCSDARLVGFMVLGCLSLFKDIVVNDEMQMQILAAMSRSEEMTAGRDDFQEMLLSVFGTFMTEYSTEGCDVPMKFYTQHTALGDRMLIDKLLPPEISAQWAGNITEPEIIPVRLNQPKKSGLSKAADRLFEPGSQIRTYIDKTILKMRSAITKRHNR